MVPHYVQGIFNMRGQIIPVMDIRARMGKPALEGDRLLIISDNDEELQRELAALGITKVVKLR